MKLISIRLCNFRQFYGKTPEIYLAFGNCNTTIFHGSNGAGKTTLMNACTWIFYEKFSAAFAASENLVNKRAIAEAEPGKTIICSGEIVFEHDRKRYQAKRVFHAYKTNTTTEVEKGATNLYMQIVGDDGRWKMPPQPPEDIINRILPVSLHQYFFFDGERIEQIVRDDKKAEIAEATKELLGVEVLNRAIKHLGEAKKALETDLRVIGNPETQKYLQDKKKLEQEIERLIKRQTEIEQELDYQNQLKQEMSRHLLDLKGAAELQKRRDELEHQATLVREQLQQANETIKQAISTQGYTVLVSELIESFREKFEKLRQTGKLQTGITQHFIQDLLHQRQCICGTELREGTSAKRQVETWLGQASVADVEEAIIRISSQVDDAEQKGSKFWQEVNQKQESVEQNRTELSRIETQLDTVKDQLRSYPDQDIQQLQKRLDEIEARINTLNRETGSNQQEINNLNRSVRQLEKQIDKQKMNEMKQVTAQRRIAATQDAFSRLTEVKDRLDQQFRSQLEKRVQNIFNRISYTPYFPKLTEKYELKLIETTTGEEAEVAASTGENQILSLSFIGGIIDGVREWSQKNTLMGPDSSTFPIMMDSPFGSLDEISRRQIAKIIPELANQLIVLVTKTQWRGEVAEEMEKRIGKEYVLSYNSPKPDCEEDSIELGGVRYPLVQRSPNEFEYTEILEVTYEF